ncbi:aminotransferase yhxA [Bacillus sp. EAC]|uniref:aminotransferase yhxA n=1 Tax=Bacillus sp. EAC TaxID=1978338 RepID=UPI000B45344E|nr:aminotransferase yhxA [Bacillus sp. EAC]
MSKTSLLMKKVSVALTGGIVVTSLAGCGSSQTADRPDKPQNDDCRDWEFDDDEGVWVCDDSTSSHYHSYYHGGFFYPSRKSLHGSSSYKSYKTSSKFAGHSSSSKGGFGKGSFGGFGG